MAAQIIISRIPFLLFLIKQGEFAQTLQKRIVISSEVLGREETMQFMIYAIEKMAGTKCVTFVSDDYLAHMVGSLTGCTFDLSSCTTYKYEIHYKEMINVSVMSTLTAVKVSFHLHLLLIQINFHSYQGTQNTSVGGNMSTMVMKTLEAGYKRKCGGYVILLRQSHLITYFLHQGDKLQIVNTRARFLIWYEANNKKFVGDEIWNKIPNVIFFHSKSKKRQSGLLFTVRELRWPMPVNSTESRVRVLELWGHKNSDKETRQVWFYDKTMDMKNVTLRLVVVEHPPGVIKYKDSSGKVDYAGTEIQIVKSLAKIMKFSYEFYDADPVTKWGGRVTSPKNSSSSGSREFYGAVARLIYGEADMGIGSFFILQHYLNHIDMSIPLEVACTSLLTPNPLPRPRYLALILPFRFELWILIIIISFILGPLILYFFASHHLHATEHDVFRTRKHVVLTSFRLMTQVALHVWPKFWPIRLYIIWYWVFWFCVTSGYRAAMVSFLTIPLYENSIDTINQLADSNLQIGGWGNELQRIFFQNLQVNTDLQIQQSLLSRYEVLDDLDTGISRIGEGNFALYENMRFLKFIRLTRNLNKGGSPTTRVMKLCVVPVHIGFAYQKNSALTLTVNRYIRLFQESGLTKRWAQRLVTLSSEHKKITVDEHTSNSEGESDAEEHSDSSPETKNRRERVLSIQDLQGLLYILFLGFGFSILIFFGEISYKRWQLRQDSKKLEADLLNMVTMSKYIIGIWTKEPQLIDVRVRMWIEKKQKPHNKLPPFPYVE